MKTIFIFFSFLSLGLSAQSDQEQILKVLDDQAICWNQGDLECFMQGYWESDSLMFVGSGGITFGWLATLERYKKNYPDRTAMGELKFEILEANPIGQEVYFLVGKFYLKRTIDDLQGIFTLVFRKINGSWLIVADHTG